MVYELYRYDMIRNDMYMIWKDLKRDDIKKIRKYIILFEKILNEPRMNQENQINRVEVKSIIARRKRERNMNNLKPYTKGDIRAIENGRKGGFKSGESKKEKKLLKEEILKRLNEKDFNEIIDNLIERAKKSDKSFELLRDTIGQKPKEENEEHEIKPPIFNIEVVDNSHLEKEFFELVEKEN